MPRPLNPRTASLLSTASGIILLAKSVALVVVGLSTAAQPLCAQSVPDERLYLQLNSRIGTVDLSNGHIIKETWLLPLVLNVGLAYDNGQLVFYNQNIQIQRDFLCKVNPASGRFDLIGPTGVSIGTPGTGPVRDPTTGRYYKTFDNRLFSVDKINGSISFIARIPTQDAIYALAIDSTGRCIALTLAVSAWQQRFPRVLELDLTTGTTTVLYHLPFFPSQVLPSAAFDKHDDLWFTHIASSGYLAGRLYKLDMTTFELTQPFPDRVFPYCTGMAFGPAPQVEGYCSPSSTSAGCTPKITWNGHPSASAHWGLEITCSDVQNYSPGILLVGIGGRASSPFAGGTLCLAPPWFAAPQVPSRGTPPPAADCSGTWTTDLNTVLFDQLPLSSGQRVQVQWFGRDPDAPDIAQHSAALEIVYMP